jgi:dCMP deaminase
MDRPDWDTVFIAMAFLVAMRSPDAETKHGAVVVDRKRRVLGTGFNGFPRGARDSELPQTRPGKYPFVIHAEINALLNSRQIDDPEACTIYVTGEPCNECFKMIVQYGIGRIVHAGVGSNCINSDEQHDLVRQALTGGLDIEVERYDDTDGIERLLAAAAGYARSRGQPPAASP